MTDGGSESVLLRWPKVPGAQSYRVTRAGKADDNTTIYQGPDNESAVPSWAEEGPAPLRVEVKPSGDDGFTKLIPFGEPIAAPEGGEPLLVGWPEADPSPVSVDVERMFAAVVDEELGEGLELVVDRLEPPAHAATLLSHSAPRDDDGAGIVVAAHHIYSVLYLSRDLGESWTPLDLFLPGRPSLRRHFLTRSGQHLVQTREPVETMLCGDDGALLSEPAQGVPAWAGGMAIDESDGAIVLVGLDGAKLVAWRSADGGKTWAEVLRGEADDDGRPVTCRSDPERPDNWRIDVLRGGWASEDDGVSWSAVEADPGATAPDVEGLRKLILLGDGQAVAIGSRGSSPSMVDVHVLDPKRRPVQRLGLENREREADVLVAAAGSRAAVDGVFFTPGERTVLSAKHGILRWRLGPSSVPPSLHYRAGDPPFATVAGREVRWFPASFEPDQEDLIVFIHAQRTGGIAFRDLMRRVYGDEAVYSATRNPNFKHWAAMSEDELAPYRVMAGHTGYIERSLRRRVLPVSLIRDPVERVVSIYRYRRSRTEKDKTRLHARGLDLEAWARKVHGLRTDYISDGQTQFLCGAADAEYAIDLISRRYFGVGVMEERAAFLAEMGRALEWPEIEEKRINTSTAPPDLVVTDEAIEFIRSVNQEDVRLHRFLLSVWEGRQG